MNMAALENLRSKIEKFRSERPHKKTPYPDDIIRDVKTLLKTYKPGRLRRVSNVPTSLLKTSDSNKSEKTQAAMNLVRLAPMLLSSERSLSLEISFAKGHSARVTGGVTVQDVATILSQLAGGPLCSR